MCPDTCLQWCQTNVLTDAKAKWSKTKGRLSRRRRGAVWSRGRGWSVPGPRVVGTMLSNKARDMVFEGAEWFYQKAAEVSASFASGIGGGWQRFVSHQRCLFQPDRRSSFLRSFSYSALFRSSTHSDQGNLWTDCIWLQSVLKPTNHWSTLVPVCGLQ